MKQLKLGEKRKREVEMKTQEEKNKEEVIIDVDGDNNEIKKTTKKDSPRKQKTPVEKTACSTTTMCPTAEVAAGPLNLAQYLVEPSWQAALSTYFSSAKFQNIEMFLAKEYSQNKEIYPPRDMIFSALNYTPLDQVKVVLIGQDPYPNAGQAHGLCFSVLPGVSTPKSLINMYKELTTDIPGFVTPNHGYLASWAEQGVLMLNATLTVCAKDANSHAKTSGWQNFTDHVLSVVNEQSNGAVFLLWGNFAKAKAKFINVNKHTIIECAHPSPLSATKWWGCKTFSKCNDALIKMKKEPIQWQLPATVSMSMVKGMVKH